MSFFKISIKSYIIFPYIVKLDICIIYFVIFDVYFEDKFVNYITYNICITLYNIYESILYLFR